ncbi:MAG: DUF885 domain-containing protein [Sphingobacteriales bacterium]|nr:DUF885 domain-containing protein [Sphingobacteriales bacterium]
MRKISLSIFLFCSMLLSFSGSTPPSKNVLFNNYKAGFIQRLWKMYPDWATMIGYHKYDSILYVPTDIQRSKELSFSDVELKKLKSFPVDQLTGANKTDYYLMENFLKKIRWDIKTLKSHEWDPSNYNIGSSFSYILSEDYAPLKTRLADFYLKLRNVAAYYTAAEKNIRNPTAEHLLLAIEQNEGTLSVFESDFVDSVKAMKFYPETEEAYLKRGKEAADAIRHYIVFLKSFKNDNPRSFRLGADLYAQKFNYDIQSTYTSDEIFKAALDRKDFLHTEMGKIAVSLWPKYFGNQSMPIDKLVLIKKVIDTISVQHVRPEDFKTEIERQLPELTAFVKEKNLVYMDPAKPLKVRKEPGYMAGVAGASMSSPGPYEKNGTAYYNVGTLDGWSAERAESYLKEYNQYILQILNIHEAIPGHYVQLMYSNKSPSVIKSILGNGAMIEGWAVYSEYMMMENGYGNNKPEMWLMYYKWNLRAVCNTILDISIHTKNMSKEAAMDLMVNQGFQQQAEAEGKWKRATLTSVQLCSYFTGFHEIMQLRDEYKKIKGSDYTVRKFNEAFLSYGSAPVKYIRELLLPQK